MSSSSKNETGSLAAGVQTWRQKYEYQETLISGLEEENESLRSERRIYIEKLKEKRGELASFQGKLDDAASEIADLKRALIRAQDAAPLYHGNIPQQVGLQTPLTPPPSASANPHLAVVADDDEIQYLGGSSPEDVSGTCAELDPTQHIEAEIVTLPISGMVGSSNRRPIPRMIPFVSLPPRTKYEPRHTEPEATHVERPTDNSARSPKRRRVEAAPIQVRTPGHEFRAPLPRLPIGRTTPSHPERSSAIANVNASPITSSKPKVKLTLLPPKDLSKTGAKPKSKNESLVVPPSIISEHMKSCTPFHISPPPRKIYFPRRFIRATYGGNDRLPIQIIKPHRNPSGPTERCFLFPTFDMNPSMPSKPGEPGLIYASLPDLTDKTPQSLFSGELGNKKAVWMYLGEYESTVCDKMSPSLYKNQRPEVKQEWGTQIRDGNRWDVHVEIRARIALRKAKLVVTADNVKEEMTKIKNDNGRPVSIEDIIVAFENGTEVIDVIKMQCVAYDQTLATDLETKFNVWNTPIAHAQRQLLKGKKKAAQRRGDLEAGNAAEPHGSGRTSDKYTNSKFRNPRIRKLRDPTTRIRDRSAPMDGDLRDSFNGAFDSDLTEYDYESGSSV